MTIHTTKASLLYKKKTNNWPPLSVRDETSSILQNLPSEICHPHLPYLQIPLRTTRHTSNINENSYRYKQLSTSTDAYKYSYFPQTITDWNSLPSSLSATLTVQSFKEVLTRHLSPDL